MSYAETGAEIVQLACLKDNYCCLIHDHSSGLTVVIDTPDADVIDAELKRRGWGLDFIFTTHHHWDHIDGHEQLKQQYGCEVIAPALNQEQVPQADKLVSDGDLLQLGATGFQVLATPGHTLGHVCYWSEALSAVFVGDTLFSLGCGRLFEGTPEQMWQSMLRLRDLPADTAVYCGHEYTQNNAGFALQLEPDNQALQQRVAEVTELRGAGLPTLPSSIRLESQTNPFMRADQAELQAALGMAGELGATVFTEIRQRKDQA